MSDLAPPPVLPLFVHTFTRWAQWAAMQLTGSATYATGNSWPAADLALYFPIWLPWPYPVKRVFWGNGSSAGGTSDFGIYSALGTKIYSTGNVARSGNSSIQYPASPDILLPPGYYYFALAHSATTASQIGSFSGASATDYRFSGVLEQASARPLPAQATFATTTRTITPFIGITRMSSGF